MRNCLLQARRKILLKAIFICFSITYVSSLYSREVWLTHITQDAVFVYPSSKQRQDKLFKSGKGSSQQIIEKAIQRGEFVYILAKLQELNLPNDLAIIPIIESQYEKNAVSSKGAAGLWQIMPATSRGFHLPLVDRFELKPSTMLALQYFKQLYQEFGNWDLALCAYNAGSHRVKSALKNSPSSSLEDLALPRETISYLKQFKALQKQFAEEVL